MDIAELGLSVRSDGVVVASDRLNKFGQEADRAERSTDKLRETARTLSTVMGAIGIAATVRGLINYADTWSDINSRIGLAVGPMGNARDVMNRLDDMAQRTYSSLTQTAESYLANATALRELGYSTAGQLDYTEALNNALVVSAIRGQRAASVSDALSKAMALGTLQGQNLTTVMQSGGRVAEAIAGHLGVTTNELRRLGQQGKITGDDIYTALTSQLEVLRGEAERMPATVGDALIRTSNAALSFVGRLDQALGASSSLAEAIILLSNNFDRIAYTVIAAAAVIGGRFVLALALAAAKAMTLAGAFGALGLAIARTGLGLIIVALGEAAMRVMTLADEIGGLGRVWEIALQIGQIASQNMGATFEMLGERMQQVAATIEASFTSAFAGVLRSVASMMEEIGRVTLFEMSGLSLWAARRMGYEGDGGLGLNLGGGAASAARAAADELENHSIAQSALAAQARARANRQQEELFGGVRERIAALRAEVAQSREMTDSVVTLTDELASAMNNIGAATTGAGQSLVNTTHDIADAQQRIAAVNRFAAESFSSLFTGAIQGARSLGDAVSNLLGQLGQMAINNAFLSLFMGSGFANTAIGGGLSSIFGIGMPAYATGTNNHPGGWARINDGGGGEIVNLPSGAQVIPADLSRRMVGGGKQEVSVNVHVTTSTTVDQSGNLLPLIQNVAVTQARQAVAMEADSNAQTFRSRVQDSVVNPRLRSRV